jgi:hypothetical protein
MFDCSVSLFYLFRLTISFRIFTRECEVLACDFPSHGDRLRVDVAHAAPFDLLHVGRTTDIDYLFIGPLDLGFLGSSVIEQHHSTQHMLLVIEEIIRILEEDRGVSGTVAMISRTLRST